MITLTAKIQLAQSDQGTVDRAQCNISGNNVSAYMGSVTNESKNAKNPFLLNSSKLGDGSTYVSEVDYYLGSKDASLGGYEIDIYGDFEILHIVFDKKNERYPTSMTLAELSGENIVYSKVYYNNSAYCILTPTTKTGKYRLYIDNWNTPNSPLVVQGIFVEVAIELNNRNLVSLNTTKNTRSTMDEPSFGIISCSGSIEFKDLDQQIQDYIENGLLKENLWCIIYLNNTLSKTQKQLDVKYTEKWNYDNENRVVSVSIKDDLEEWQDIYVEGFNYEAKQKEPKNMEWYYKFLYDRTPRKYEMLAFDELDANTRNILTNTIVNYPLLDGGSLWAQWQKICEVCALYIFKNTNNKTTCSYRYGA